LTQASFRITLNVEPDKTEEWSGEGIAGRLVKSEPERRYTLTVAYPANRPDVGKARDGHRDFADRASVETAAWNYLRKSRRVGRWHADGTDGSGETVESYIYRGPDWVITSGDSEYVVKDGDWLVGIIWDEPSFAEIRSGKIGGTSIQGTARRSIPTPADIARLRSK
jgi:hypothetical protein